jgi:FixJ family two-component response regulator
MLEHSAVYVVDNDAATRELVSSIAESMAVDCRSYASGTDFLDDYTPNTGGCLVLEVRIPDISGLQIQRRLRDAADSLAVVFLSSHATTSIVCRAIKSGAVDFLDKPADEHSIWSAIQQGLQLCQKRERLRLEREEWDSRMAQLRARERDILRFVLKGHKSREIAETMEVSIRTVEAGRSNLLKKLGVDSNFELVSQIARMTPLRCCVQYDDDCPCRFWLCQHDTRIPGSPNEPAQLSVSLSYGCAGS